MSETTRPPIQRVAVLVRYDNLKTAATKILKGRDRTENERFIALRSHYGFESFFCEPGIAGAHEKGGVEGDIGRFRRNHLTPVPAFATLADLNAHLEACDTADGQRWVTGRGPGSGDRVHSLAALERPALWVLPGERFAAVTRLSARVDTKARVCVRQCFYSVPARLVGQRVTIVAPTRAGYLSAYPVGGATTSSVLNYGVGQTVANLAIVRPDADGWLTIAMGGTATGSANVVVDVFGWFSTSAYDAGTPFDENAPNNGNQDDEHGARLIATDPGRILDWQTTPASLSPGESLQLPIRGADVINSGPANIVPDDASVIGVMLNVTAVFPGLEIGRAHV